MGNVEFFLNRSKTLKSYYIVLTVLIIFLGLMIYRSSEGQIDFLLLVTIGSISISYIWWNANLKINELK